METTAESGIWTLVIGIILGVGSGFLVVWLAMRMTPYMYNFLFSRKSDSGSDEENEASTD